MLRILTLFFALSLILTVDAHIDNSIHRRHAPAANRMIKKRAGPFPGLTGGANNAAQPANVGASPSASASPSANSDVTTPTDTISSASAISLTSSATPSASSASAVSTPTPSGTPSIPASSAAVTDLINTILSQLSPNTNTTSSSRSSSTSASAATGSTSLIPSSSSSAAPTPTQLATTPDAQSLSSVDPTTITRSTVGPAATAASSSQQGSVTKLQRNTIIILIAIGASIGAAGIIWTIIRKWKFSPSRTTDDRLQPIDWQPTTGVHDEHDITEKLTRNGSTRSHGSFTSGNNHDNLVPELPAHDFTAGPAHLAPVGGYADLQRGPSPQPDLQRGPSFRGQGDYQYEIPNPHGQYYTGAPGAGAGMHQGGYDYNRGY